MSISAIQSDSRGLFTHVDCWVVRVVDGETSSFAEGAEVYATASKDGSVLIEGEDCAEDWEMTLPTWWHPTLGAVAWAKLNREEDLERNPEVYTVMMEAFNKGEILG